MGQVLDGVNHHLDRVYGSGDPVTLFVAVMFSHPQFLHTGSDLDEPSGGAYARVAVTNDESHWGAAAQGIKTNSLDILFPTATANWGTLRHWAISDASTGGRIITWGNMPQRLIVEGATLRFPRDELVITLR